MPRPGSSRSSRLFLTFALATALALPLLGQEQDQSGPSVEGTVSDISGSVLKLLNGLVTVDATAAAVVSEHDNTPLTLADITVGTVVQVVGAAGPGGQIQATLIQVHGPKFDGQIQGPIDSVDLVNGRFSILGQTISIVASTLFEGDNGAPFGASDLTPGMAVDVEVAVFQGSLIATRISLSQGAAGETSSGSNTEN